MDLATAGAVALLVLFGLGALGNSLDAQKATLKNLNIEPKTEFIMLLVMIGLVLISIPINIALLMFVVNNILPALGLPLLGLKESVFITLLLTMLKYRHPVTLVREVE